MGKKAKEHRKRVAKRNQRIADEKKRFEKMAMKFLNTIIDKENAEGKFNNPVQPLPAFDGSGPNLGLPFTTQDLGFGLPTTGQPLPQFLPVQSLENNSDRVIEESNRSSEIIQTEQTEQL